MSIYDLDAERGTLLVRHGKGRKDRTLPIGERAVLWIDKYCTEVHPLFSVEPDEGVLFLGVDGQGIGLHRLTELVREYVDRTQVGKRGSCHPFRHSMAMAMLEGGADVRYVQEMLGHALLETTQIYTKVSIRQLQRVYAACHPAAIGGHIEADAEDGAGEADDPARAQQQRFSSPAEEADVAQAPSTLPAPPSPGRFAARATVAAKASPPAASRQGDRLLSWLLATPRPRRCDSGCNGGRAVRLSRDQS